MKRVAAIAWILGCLPCFAEAQDLQLHGYADARLQLATGDDESWTEGGLGKARLGGDDETSVQVGGVLQATWQVTPALLAFADVQVNSQTSPVLGVLEAYVRYRPVSTTPWRWSVRAGAFFPPISLENEGIGWTSRWTLTPSAINSWVGEELRTVGAEFRVEHRGNRGTIDFGVAAFKWNDPAGELLASRGWALGDMTSALNADVRQPDVHAAQARAVAPLYFDPFVENDGKIGWHADLRWEMPGGGKLSLLRYDNRADPESFGMFGEHKVFSWHTRFWSLGAEVPIGNAVLIAQVMDGSTAFEPRPGLYLDTKLHAGFLLVGWGQGAWRPAVRLDMFSTRQLPDTLAAPLSEHGHAWTVALNWRPRPWLRVTGEVLRIDSSRNQRLLEGLAPRQVDTQVQLGIRWLF